MAMAAMVAACGVDDAPEPAVEMDPVGAPRVFFVTPQDGARVSGDAPVVFEFGIENYQIAPVPDPLPESVEQVRPGVGHYHLGVNTECLPPRVEIPMADPWIHFGDGSNTIDMLLEPGEYRFTVQLADDLHYTLEGLCQTITVVVEEGTGSGGTTPPHTQTGHHRKETQ